MKQKTSEKIHSQTKNFPIAPGLYFMKDRAGAVLYIGKAGNLRSRVRSYFQPGSDLISSRGPKIVEMVNKTCTVEYLETKSEVDAILQEARLIKDIRPPYNTNLIDDKTFPYLEITGREDFPSVYITRKPRKTSRLFGPFTAVKDLRAAMVILQKIFKFRTCSLDISSSDKGRKYFRPCLLYSIKQCTAPCGDRISRADYKKIIIDLAKFLNSKRSTILRQLNKQMAVAAETLDYETAATLRDRIRLIERLDHRGTVSENVQPELFAVEPTEALEKLQKILNCPDSIRVIEGFDIAHIAGSETVGSLVKFIDGKPFRSGYRRFRIKTVSGIDDYACLGEVVTRRYRQAALGKELWPDLVLIDGGIGQLNAVAEVFRQMEVTAPPLASIAKREELIHIFGQDKPIRLPANSPAKKLLQYVRDEAHRFAQHYHHILRRKKTLQ